MRPDVIFADDRPAPSMSAPAARSSFCYANASIGARRRSSSSPTDPVAASFADSVVFIVDGQVSGELTAPTPEQVADVLSRLGERW